MSDFPLWVYHKHNPPKIIQSGELDAYMKDGWRESPAPFIDAANFGVDPNDAVAVQNLGDVVQGVVDAANGAIAVDRMGKRELSEYALEHFGVELDKRAGVRKLRAHVQGLIDGNSD